MKKGILIKFCSISTCDKVPKTHPFSKKLKYRHPRNKEHTRLNFLIESQSSHTDIHVIVKLCKKPISFLKTTLTVFPLARKLVIKTHWHILYIVLSPLIIVSATRRRKTEKKKKLLHQEWKQSEGWYAPFSHRDEPSWARRVRWVGAWSKSLVHAQPGVVCGGKRSWQARKTHQRRGRRSTRERFQEPPRPVGPKNAPGAERVWSADRSAQGHGKGDVQKLKDLRSVRNPSVSHSFCLFWMNVFPPGTAPVRGGRPSPSWDYKVLKHYQVF